jgi:ABC-2 type transport system permease protein
LPSMGSRWRRNLLAASAWSHRGAIAAWVLGISLLMILFSYSFRSMVEGFAGGAAGFGFAAQATANAMKPLVGPAYRLDTYAGYITYHNEGWLALMLSVYACIQGARAVRGLDEQGRLALFLATGLSRWKVARDRVLGFCIALAAIGLGAGVGTGLGTQLSGSPAWTEALIVSLNGVLAAAVFYAIALLVSQFTRTSRSGAGLTAAFALVTYVLSNISDQLGALAWLRFLSPFYFFQQSKFAMIPGHGADAGASLAMLVAVVTISATAALALQRRDVDAALIRIPALSGKPHWRVRLGRPGGRSLWTAFLREQPVGLLAWFVGAFALEAVYLSIFPQVRDMWEKSDLVRVLVSRAGGSSMFDSFMALTVGFVAIVSAAFAVVQAGRWLGDRSDGRDEIYLAATPVSRLRLDLERWLALAVGLAIVTSGALLGMLLGSLVAGVSLRADALLRTGADLVLVGLAVGGLSAAVVAWLRSGRALAVLSAILAGSYFLTLLQPLFKWPDWTAHMSVFDAFGYPYVAVPAPIGLALMAGLACVGATVAATISSRRSTV